MYHMVYLQMLMVGIQAMSLSFAIYFTTTMVHNWVVVCNPRMDCKIPGGVFHNTAGRAAAMFWGLFYWTIQL